MPGVPNMAHLNLYGNTDNRKLLVNYNLLVSDFFKNPEKKYYLLEGGSSLPVQQSAYDGGISQV